LDKGWIQAVTASAMNIGKSQMDFKCGDSYDEHRAGIQIW